MFHVELQTAAKEVEVTYKGRRVLAYRFGAAPFKPYVRELYTVDGLNVLRDAPADHLHHHALMYAIKVNGVNFWEETPQAGYQITGPAVSRRVARTAAGQPVAEFSHTVYWVPVKDAPEPAAAALLVEQRSLALTVDEAEGEVALEWRAEFTVGRAATKVTLGGTAYHGLGVRFIEPFDKTARRLNAAGASYTAEATSDLSDAAWASTSQTLAGREVTVSIFDAPDNAGEPRFFSMLNGFTYLSATQALDVKPLEYTSGQKFSLRYLITVRTGPQTVEALNRRHQQWLGR